MATYSYMEKKLFVKPIHALANLTDMYKVQYFIITEKSQCHYNNSVIISYNVNEQISDIIF